MKLQSVELINWRSYKHARFDFPETEPGKNVILIMAPNEHGKTSFFEAVTLGLFGRDGLILVPRARSGTGDSAADRLKASYSQFLQSTLHSQARESGAARCAVTLEFTDDDGEPIELSRVWHFRPDGTHKPGDDDLKIYQGIGRIPVVPPMNIGDRDEWYRDWIAQHFLHSSLAEFFLFDGEQVQRYANREMGDQVRRGIEGLLGLPILRSLKESLESYAQHRRTAAAAPSDSTVQSVKADIAGIEEEIAKQKRLIEEAEAALPALDKEIDELTQSLGGGGEGTTAMVGRLMQTEQRYREEAGRAMDSMLGLISEDLAIGIAGKDLRKATIKQLEAEEKKERWESGKAEGSQNIDRFAEELRNRLLNVTPPLDSPQAATIVELAKEAYGSLWYPPPEGCADDYYHPSISGNLRMQVVSRLEQIDAHSNSEISGYAERFRAAVEQADAAKREWQEIERSAPETEKQTARLKELSEEAGSLRRQHKDAQLALQGKEAELSSKRAELGRYMSKLGTAGPALRRANYAEEYASLISDLLKDALPNEVGEVAKEMTKAWKAMSHLSDRIERIEITPECEVRMVTKDGGDLHKIDKSAGASQVFTQALITAITRVSGRDFPFIVDTPLARLSRAQRIGVLKEFTDRKGQVILLSTDEEVVADKLDAIRSRVRAAYELKVTPNKGVASTSVHDLSIEDL
jgi:DNA sulfur modification protein DndD